MLQETMLKKYLIKNGELTLTSEEPSDVWMYTQPNEEEKNRLFTEFQINEHTLHSALDPDEPSRLEFEPDHMALIFKYPQAANSKDRFRFGVASAGLFLFQAKLMIVASEEIPMSKKHLMTLQSPQDVLLKLIYGSIDRILEHLKVINLISEEIEKKINISMENKHLINLFNLEKSLVYYLKAVDSNGFVFEKLKNNAKKIGFSKKELDYLDDLIIENNQCHRQAEIHSLILAEMMDARVSIVKNNISILVKTLNLITIAIMVPTFVVSAFSMNVPIPGQNGPHAFWMVLSLAATSLLGLLIWWKLRQFR